MVLSLKKDFGAEKESMDVETGEEREMTGMDADYISLGARPGLGGGGMGRGG